MKQVTIVSVGPGHRKGLTLGAMQAIQSAAFVFCAPRHEALVPPEKARPLSPLSTMPERVDALSRQEADVAVLVSGDAGLYSLLPMLRKRLGEERIRVIPGVSSLQAMMAALGLPWQGAAILSAHGRELSESALCHEVRTHRDTLLLLDARRNPSWVQQTLTEGGVDAQIYVGERLGSADQSLGLYEDRAYDALSVACIRNEKPVSGLPIVGLPDDAFLRADKVPMTKQEIRTQVLATLRLTTDALIWDVGAGTGSVSIECARQCPRGQVYAIEKNEAALNVLKKNRQHFHASNLTPIFGKAPDVLTGLPTPTHVFMGGIGNDAAAVIDLLKALNQPIRLVATAVTMESMALLTQLMSGLDDFAAVQLSVSRLEQVGRYTLFKAQNPVTIFACTLNGKEETT